MSRSHREFVSQALVTDTPRAQWGPHCGQQAASSHPAGAKAGQKYVREHQSRAATFFPASRCERGIAACIPSCKREDRTKTRKWAVTARACGRDNTPGGRSS
eukprot:1161222-Pelagomonas_calceolata.AAC.13